MAEFGDALSTAITSQNENKPSLFEVVAQDNLNAAVRPAMKHIIKVFAQNYPHHFSFIYSWYDECYTLIECGIQFHFLSNYSASFAEHYYDLTRTSMKSRSMKLLSVAALSVFPYLQNKLDDLFNTIKEKSFQSGYNSLSVREKLLLFGYPIFHTIWNFSFVCYCFLYAVGKSSFHSPLYKVLNIELEYINLMSSSLNKSSSRFSQVFTQLLTGGVHGGVFIIQFIEWWFNDDNDTPLKQIIKTSLPNPPSLNEFKTKIPVPGDKICPLCNKARKNETALLTSGYVFCYVCVYKHVKEKRNCPVTGYKTDLSNLVKIYPPA